MPVSGDVVQVGHAVTVPAQQQAYARQVQFVAGGRISYGQNTRLRLGL